jgi:hypothetical protein
MNKRQLQKLKRNSKKHIFRADMCHALAGISRYEARLHMIVLFGNYNYVDIVEALGEIWVDNKFKSDIRNPGYRKKAIRQEKNFFLVVFYSPKNNCLPWCTIEIHPQKDFPVQTYKDFLKGLNKKLIEKLPDIKVSAVEYAIDVFCYEPEYVRELQWLIRRCLYLRNQMSVITFDNDEINVKGKDVKISYIYGWDKQKAYDKGYEIIEMNEVYRVGDYHKAYERGPDDNDKKKGLGWKVVNLDRVRMEYTADRDKLKEEGIFTLPDLIDDAHFKAINENKWVFRKFERSTILPKIWQPYLEQQPPFFDIDKEDEDYQGFDGTYQLEHIRALDLDIANFHQNSKEIKEIIPFEEQLNEAIYLFEKQWRNDTAILKG